jgi:hypothetical protein
VIFVALVLHLGVHLLQLNLVLWLRVGTGRLLRRRFLVLVMKQPLRSLLGGRRHMWPHTDVKRERQWTGIRVRAQNCERCLGW